MGSLFCLYSMVVVAEHGVMYEARWWSCRSLSLLLGSYTENGG